MSLYPNETERDDGLGRLCEHECHGCGVVLFNHKPDVGCDELQDVMDALRMELERSAVPVQPRIMEVLCEPCAESIADALSWFFGEMAEQWRELRDRAYERSGLTQCCDVIPIVRGDGYYRCVCGEIVDECGRRFEP